MEPTPMRRGEMTEGRRETPPNPPSCKQIEAWKVLSQEILESEHGEVNLNVEVIMTG